MLTPTNLNLSSNFSINLDHVGANSWHDPHILLYTWASAAGSDRYAGPQQKGWYYGKPPKGRRGEFLHQTKLPTLDVKGNTVWVKGLTAESIQRLGEGGSKGRWVPPPDTPQDPH